MGGGEAAYRIDINPSPTSARYRPTHISAREKHALLPPTEVAARYDIAKSLLLLQVTPAKGFRTCVIEISTDPSNPASWKRLQGSGLKRAVAGYAPGTYWIRAASVRAQEESDFTTPVPVVVK